MAGPEATAVRVAASARDGQFALIADLFAEPLRTLVSADDLRAAWATELRRVGDISAIGEPTAQRVDEQLVRVSVQVTGARGTFTVVVSVDDDQRLHGLRLDQDAGTDWEPPSYADPSAFVEHEVGVGSGARAVAGAMSIPRGRDAVPAVVLLSGGGPFDRDETSGPNKPLADIAWGLASRGVATLRFDKVTRAHPEASDDPGFTMTEEYVPHAVSAIRLLRERPEVDAGRIFVLGHSMGGKAAPRVAAAEPAVAGLVIMAGDTEPMHHAAVRVSRYLASLAPGPHATARTEALARGAAVVDSPELSAATPRALLPLGLSGGYWLDLRDYDPVSAAAASTVPLLVLQGGRDYQVTLADDFARWRSGLARHPDVTFRVYPEGDHLFFPGEGPSTPAGYGAPQHVAPAVITDIADWLAKH